MDVRAAAVSVLLLPRRPEAQARALAGGQPDPIVVALEQL